MNVIFTVLVAFALGYLINQRTGAVAIYLAADALLFSYQTLTLLLEWVGGSDAAFGAAFPHYQNSEVVAYGVVNLVITLIGVGLVFLGAWAARRRVAKRGVVSVG